MNKHSFFLISVIWWSVFVLSCKPQVKTAEADGITVVPAEEVGLDQGKLNEMETELARGTYNIHSILILRHNKLAYEKYFQGKDEMFATPLGVVNHGRDSLHDCRSITKSVVSACIGVAIEQKKIKDVNDKVISYFPGYSKYDTGSKRELTIKHLLTMSDGLEWNERIPYNDPKNSESQMLMNPDVVDFVLSRPIVTRPGTAWNYSGGTTQLLSKILEKVSGLTVDSFANKYVFIPIGIDRYSWYKRDDGTPWAPSGLRLRPIDMAKFGLLYINGGKHNGQQIIPEAWVTESITTQVKRHSGSEGYGYQFWCGRDSILGKDVKIALGIGYGGQRIYLLPAIDLVIVVTAGNYNEHSDLSDEVVGKFIRPAIKNN